MACKTRCETINVAGEGDKSMCFVNMTFDELARDNENITTFDVRCVPHYTEKTPTNGIFLSDGCHYNKETNMWVAKKIISDYCNKYFG
jgi:hypothetical protein